MKKEKAERNAPIVIDFAPDEKLELNFTYRKNFGYSVISKIYHELEIDKFMINRQHGTKLEFSCNNIMKLLVYSRLLTPASKRKTLVLE